jgi:hypothetical protein
MCGSSAVGAGIGVVAGSGAVLATTTQIATRAAVAAPFLTKVVEGIRRSLDAALGATRAAPRTIQLVNGYYQAEGTFIKFSQQYYERLIQTGRPAPFLAAQEILRTATTITQSEVGGAFLKYSNGLAHIIYNPATTEVWHIGVGP